MKDPILVGLAGEHATSDYLTRHGFKQHVDLKLRPLGDQGRDLEVAGMVLQMKTRRKTHGRNFVRRVDDRKRVLPLSCDAFVFVQWDDTHHNDPALLLGWIWARDVIEQSHLERSPMQEATHWNLRVPDVSLDPMNRLVDELVSRQEWV